MRRKIIGPFSPEKNVACLTLDALHQPKTKTEWWDAEQKESACCPLLSFPNFGTNFKIWDTKGKTELISSGFPLKLTNNYTTQITKKITYFPWLLSFKTIFLYF